ncbi:MAG: ABC transporter substrate-binding protein [Myxococcota bacterium]
MQTHSLNHLVASHPLLGTLDTKTQLSIIRVAVHTEVPTGRTLVRAGDTSSVFFLLSGAVAVVQRSAKNRRALSLLLKAPAVVGDSASLAGYPAFEDVISTEPSSLLAVTAKLLRRLLRTHPRLAEALLLDQAERMCRLSDGQRAIAFGGLEERLADILLDYGELSGKQRGNELRIATKITQSGLGQYLGVGRTSTVHAFDTLKRKGLVHKESGRYTLLNVESLRAQRAQRLSRVHQTRHQRGATPQTSNSATPTTVHVRFPIPAIEAGQAFFYLALERDLFVQEGLDVQFHLSSRELDPIRSVATGKDLIGVMGGPDAIVAARSRGVPIKAIAVLQRRSNYVCIVSPKDRGIRKVTDLQGKRIGFYYGHISTEILRSWFRQCAVTVEEIDVGWELSPLLVGEVDAMWSFTVVAESDLRARGIEITVLSPADHGIITHGYTVFARDDVISEQPHLITRFLRGLFAGVCAVFDDPEAGLATILQRDPRMDFDINRRRLQMHLDVTSNSKRFPPGYMDSSMFSEAYQRLAKQGIISKPYPIHKVYTLEFLQTLYPKKRWGG